VNKHSFNIPTVKIQEVNLSDYVTAGKTLLGKWQLEIPIKKWDNKGNIYIHTYIHKYIHTYIHKYIHTHIHTVE